MAVAAGVFVAAIFIVWPAVAGRRSGLKESPEPVQAAIPESTIGDQTELPEPIEMPRARLGQSLTVEEPADTAMPQYAEADLPDAPNAADVPDEPVAPAGNLPRQQVIMLSADDPAFDLGSLSSGQTLRGDAERRPVIEVPPGGFVVAADDVTFENIDFVAAALLSAGAAMVTLKGSHVVFDGCSFAAESEAPGSSLVAIAWVPEVGDSSLLEVRNSSFQNVSAAVGQRVSGIASSRIENVLHVGPGPLVVVDRQPEFDERLALTLSHVTVRDAQSVVAIGCQQLPAELGRIEIEASDCVFALRSAAALVVYDSAVRPGPLLAGLRWAGQGSVLSGR